MINTNPFIDFGNESNYQIQLGLDLNSLTTLEASFFYSSTPERERLENIWSVVSYILSSLYHLAHDLVGTVIVPGFWHSAYEVRNYRMNLLDVNNGNRYKRITIEVDGYQIDTLIVMHEDAKRDRWMLVSLGNGDCYEAGCRSFDDLLYQMGANAVFFNYPGVGSSSGWPNRQAMKNTYLAMLQFLEEKIKAKEVIGYGHSLGGGVQGDALCDYEFKSDMQYVFIKDRTFSNLAAVASSIVHPWIAPLISMLGWNIDSIESSKKLSCLEVIIQAAHVETPATSSDVLDDGVITKEASLASSLLDLQRSDKIYIGLGSAFMREHDDPHGDRLSAQIMRRVVSAMFT